MPPLRKTIQVSGRRVTGAPKSGFKVDEVTNAYAGGLTAREIAKDNSLAISTVFQKLRQIRAMDPSIDLRRAEAIKSQGKVLNKRGKPKNPASASSALQVQQRKLLRLLRDKGYSDAFAQGMRVNKTAELFGKSPKIVSQRLGALKTFDPTLESWRKESKRVKLSEKGKR
jgi:hypothetical protein